MAEFVLLAEEYLYNSAANYYGKPGLLGVKLIADGFSELIRSVKL